MYCLSRVLAAGALSAAVLAFPVSVSAQGTLTGRLIELWPGGPVRFPRLSLELLASDGSQMFFRSVDQCETGETTDCVAADGSFTVLDLTNGPYLLVANGSDTFDLFRNVNIDGNTSIGDLPMTRRYFEVETTLGEIPAAGGNIPISVRVRTLWAIPTMPISVRVAIRGDSSHGEFAYELPFVINAWWPAGLTDSGRVSLPSIHVPASEPAGVHRCVEVIITGQGSFRHVVTDGSMRCDVKQP